MNSDLLICDTLSSACDTLDIPWDRSFPKCRDFGMSWLCRSLTIAATNSRPIIPRNMSAVRVLDSSSFRIFLVFSIPPPAGIGETWLFMPSEECTFRRVGRDVCIMVWNWTSSTGSDNQIHSRELCRLATSASNDSLCKDILKMKSKVLNRQVVWYSCLFPAGATKREISRLWQLKKKGIKSA